MEESLKAPRPGDVLVGRVLLITRDSVIIDINYKCEGQVPLEEFLIMRVIPRSRKAKRLTCTLRAPRPTTVR